MSFLICCTYPLIYRIQLSTPSCPGNLTNHSPHTMENEHRKGEETIESAIVLQTQCYAMLPSNSSLRVLFVAAAMFIPLVFLMFCSECLQTLY